MCNCVIYIWFLLVAMSLYVNVAEKIRYISTERPHVTYFNPKFMSYANITSKRYSRQNPFYYVDIHGSTLVTFDDNMTIHLYLTQDIGNGHFRSIFEVHRKWCNFITMDTMFGAPIRQGKLKKPCPHPPDHYHMYNMTIPIDNIPRSLPYIKGRITCNVTYVSLKEPILSGYIDMELKDFKRH